MQPDMNQSLMQDFLTESAELLEALDADLVKLERDPAGKNAADLLNNIFRALHTIKGAAGFLGLTVLITFAHAAEDALNRLRKGDVVVTGQIMDALLRSVDVVRGMTAQIAAGQPITPGPQALIDQLHAIAENSAAKPQAAATPATPSAPATVAAVASQTAEPSLGRKQLHLPAQKTDLLDFMVADLREAARLVSHNALQLRSPASASDAAEHLGEIGREVQKTAEFFDLHSLNSLGKLIAEVSPRLNETPESLINEIACRLEAMSLLIVEQSEALAHQQELLWPLQTLEARVRSLAEGVALPSNVPTAPKDDARAMLAIDGLSGEQTESITTSATPVAITAAAQDEATTSAATAATSVVAPTATQPTAAADPEHAGAQPAGKNSIATDQTVRVEVARLEALLNLVGQLVLNKNRVMGLARRLRESGLPHELKEEINGTAGDLDRLTSELQVGVMRTRMQPLAKLFDRYPRVIRDLARATDKKIELKIGGKETEVDKSVLELLSDPLVHILRNSADHGIESPATRLAAGKSESGSIRLSAEHQGSHVRVEITDDGKGLDRAAIGRKAVEKGLATAEQIAAMPDEEIFRYIFAAGLSTAEKVTDLSGRGVGMDVVRTNIAKLNGQVTVNSVLGKGTTIEILIPLTVAILPAMLVGVGTQNYAVPLASIVEIVRPEPSALHSVMGRSVLKLRDLVLPLVDLRTRLGEQVGADTGKFTVVIAVGQQRTGLIVDRLIGQQEVVIKPMDDKHTAGGPFSGATILEDGSVSLILDCLQLVRQAKPAERAAA
jgi:two-component system, chemotaxis family, sensor kinase CheA